MDLALNNQQNLICYKTKPTKLKLFCLLSIIISHLKLYDLVQTNDFLSNRNY